ncbi:O-antigen ligase family protein [Paractinoplanes brasiliensis]|uniref:O-antigen ligase family protein n=1 Tax=Paractinoplanes brasiliensis TaxID=52695 RepID=UPI001EF22D32|nr:O-antigen ligase family protein [Actinoplanes brasiliensis]
MSAAAVPSTAGPAHGVRAKTGLPAWPVASILAFYPIWWALGLGVLIFAVMAVPMLFLLLRRRAAGRPLLLPPGFVWWAVFLIAVVVSMGALGADPAGTVAGHATGRLLPAGYKALMYASLTVLLVYAGNLTEAELPRRRLVKLLGWLFVVTVLGGLLGMVAGTFEFTSPVEWLLPSGVRNKGFVQSLVHPYAAQIMDIVGDSKPRPAAPWGYTNTWGNNFCLLAGWLVVAAWQSGSGKAKFWTVVCLVVSVVPAVVSLNRGLWIGIGVLVVYVATRYVLAGKLWIIGAVVMAAALLGVALIATPLGEVVGARLDNGKSNGVRSFLIERALDGFQDSPVIGYGGTRSTLGGRNSITVGESAGCERCGNFTVGGNGQLWQLLYAHGAAGAVGYLGFFAYGLWRFRRDRSAIGVAAGGAIVTSFSAMLWYNSLVTPLAFMVLAFALLWRNSIEGETT